MKTVWRRVVPTAELIDRGSREHYLEPWLYDAEYRNRIKDIQFYTAFARKHSKAGAEVLELGCGSGRVSQGLVKAGRKVLGIDSSSTMLAAAQSRVKTKAANFLADDIRTFSLHKKFPLIFLPFNTVEHLYTRVDFAACLTQVRSHLAASGFCVFDVQNPDPAWLSFAGSAEPWSQARFRHPHTKESYQYVSHHAYDWTSQIALIRLSYVHATPKGSFMRWLSQRKFFPAELEALVALHGFRVVARFGDFSGRSLNANSPSQIVVCTAR